MTLNKIRKNTLIILLLCVLVIGSLGVSDVLQAKWWTPPSWLVKAWNVITGMKDTLEGIELLIDALTLEIKEAEAKIIRIKEMKRFSLKYRNILKERIIPDEQEETAAKIAMNTAAEEHDKALSKAKKLREEIAELEAELELTYYSDERYGNIEFAINLKKSSLASAELTMETEWAKYKAARYKVNILSEKLSPDRNRIARTTYTINLRDTQIENLQDKIGKLQQEILDEQARWDQLDADIKAEEEEYKKKEQRAKQPGPRI